MITLFVLAVGSAVYCWFHHHNAKANKG